MSSPVVVIGFILLVPSILGIVSSAFMFLAVNTVNTQTEDASITGQPVRPLQSDFDGGFRRSCAAAVRRNSQQMGTYTPQQTVEQICECSLSAFKETGSARDASQACAQKIAEGTLEPLSQNVDAFYSTDVTHQSPVATTRDLDVFRVAGSGFAIAIGIGSFVGGLLGWLLVMRKRVLQCDVCGAVVNAS